MSRLRECSLYPRTHICSLWVSCVRGFPCYLKYQYRNYLHAKQSSPTLLEVRENAVQKTWKMSVFFKYQITLGDFQTYTAPRTTTDWRWKHVFSSYSKTIQSIVDKTDGEGNKSALKGHCYEIFDTFLLTYSTYLGPIWTGKNRFTNFFVFAKIFNGKVRKSHINDYADTQFFL